MKAAGNKVVFLVREHLAGIIPGDRQIDLEKESETLPDGL